MKIASVIVTFNRLSQLKTTFRHTLLSDIDLLIIVNNASTDGTKEWLERQSDDRLVVLNLHVNIGGAGGFHEGFKYVVQKTNVDWLVCYDDDAYPSCDAINIFRGLKTSNEVAGIAAAVYLPDGRISEMNRPSRNPFNSVKALLKTLIWRREGFHVSDAEYQSKQLVKIDYSSFVGCFLRLSAIKSSLGFPRKELFIYADDIMYTLGIGASGYEHRFAPMVKFIHDCATLHEQRAIYKPLWKAYYTYRNGLELYRQIAGSWLFYPIAWLKLVSWLTKAKHYESPSTYRHLTWRAWRDGMHRDFSLGHPAVLELAKPNAHEKI